MNDENELVIEEWRGVEELVAAEVTADTSSEITFGEVFPIAGVAEISKTTEGSSDSHYYDNKPAIVITSEGADTININASALPLEVEGKLTGQVYDPTTGALIEGERTQKYFAIGYKTEKTNGDKVYVWRFKGTFSKPDKTNATKNNGTDANGQTLVYTNITTTHKFTKNNNKGAKALNVDTGKDLANVTNFFTTVTTPDTLQAKA